jgi:signal recognition particle subunit SRP54
MAGRILGMGDVLSLVEKVEEEIEQDEALEMQRKILEKKFNFEDFYNQFQQVKKLGPLQGLVGMIPGMGGLAKQLDEIDPKKFSHLEAMILSMTPEERRNPEILNRSRKERIAGGAGVDVNEVNMLCKQFDEAKKMIEQLTGGQMRFKRPAGGIKASKKKSKRKKEKRSRRRRN